MVSPNSRPGWERSPAILASGMGGVKLLAFVLEFDAGSHGLLASKVEEGASPMRGVVVPGVLEVFVEQVGPHRLQVIAPQIARANLLMMIG